MPAGFADIIAACGVWIGGRKAAVATPAAAHAPVLRGRVYSDRSPTGHHRTYAYDYQDEDALRLVDRAIKEVLDKERPTPRKRAARVDAPAFQPSTEELTGAVEVLFASPALATLEAADAAKARAAFDRALAQIEWDQAWADLVAREAAVRDEEEAALLLLL